MKSLTAAALAEIAKQLGTEPLTILEIEWHDGSFTQYADREIQGIEGRILSVTPIQSSITPQNAENTEVTVVLDDTDGAIKTILDTVDVHKRNATVYQFYGGLTLSDKFTVFKGKISTPFTWGENDRQVSFSILSEIENYEVGFSPEEGQLDFVSEDFIGVPWPLAFGHVVRSPAQKVKQVGQAKLLDLLCLHDILLEWKLDEIARAYQFEYFILDYWSIVLAAAREIAPPAKWILTALVRTIIQEDLILTEITADHVLLDRTIRESKKQPKNKDLKNAIRFLRFEIDRLSFIADVIARYKEVLYNYCEAVRYEYDLKKRAQLEQINSVTRMKYLYDQYMQTTKQLCEQLRCERPIVRVDEAKKAGFPDNAETDVVIKGVRARVKFDHSKNTMEVLTLPIERYTDIKVKPWTPDDEPCTNITEIDGMDMFRLDYTNPPSLEDQYLLVEAFDGTVHIIRVKRQTGNKVYFKLVPWALSGGGRGLDLDKIINKIVQSEYVPGPFGSPVPKEYYTGDFDGGIWGLTPSRQLLQILRLTGPVNKDELRALAKLVFIADREERLDQIIIKVPTPQDVYTIIGPNVKRIIATCGIVPRWWLTNYEIPFEEVPRTNFWEAQPGTSIYPNGPDCEIYIANLLPSTIKAVHAYRTNKDGERYLAPIPSRYYIKNEAADLGAYTVTALTFPRALKSIPGENWEDDVYVTLNSSVGQNVVDVIEWLINTYTDKSANASNFSAVKTKVANYPVNFTLTTRPNVLEEIVRIAWESRLGIYIRGDEFFLKYLSEEPTQDDTIVEQDIEVSTLKVDYTRTEELVTRMVATYHKDYSEEPKRLVLRHNVKKYGLHSRDEYYHIYSDYDLVLKSATFHMIRQSNTWKKVRLRTFHTKIRLDLFDTVLLNLQGKYFSNGQVKGVIESVIYDSASNAIDLVINVGIRTGEMDQYQHFWPALEDPNAEYPTDAEIQLGYAGGYGPGKDVNGTIDDCPGGF